MHQTLGLYISVITYSVDFLDWMKEETKEVDCWTRKQLIAGRALRTESNDDGFISSIGMEDEV